MNLWAYVAIDTDRRRAIDESRATLAFHAGIPQYEEYFAEHGFGDAARAVAAATAKGDLAAAAAAIDALEDRSIACPACPRRGG